MRRRDFIKVVAGSAAAWPFKARAQQPDRTRLIGVLMGYAESDRTAQSWLAAFRGALTKLGWTENSKVQIELRWTAGDADRMRMLAKELVEMRPNAILGVTTPVIAALAHETTTISIVFTGVSDPVGSGFVANLAHPGGNITGFMSNEPTLGGKWPELLKEIAPEVAHIGILFNPETAPYAEPFLRHAEVAGRSLGVQVTASRARNDGEIERNIAEIATKPGGGLIVLPEATTNARYELIIAVAARHHVPAIYAYRYQAMGGGLISYISMRQKRSA